LFTYNINIREKKHLYSKGKLIKILEKIITLIIFNNNKKKNLIKIIIYSFKSVMIFNDYCSESTIKNLSYWYFII